MPRAAPMNVASSVMEERTRENSGDQTSGVARMNRAAQRLENSRAALNSPIGGGIVSDSNEEGDAEKTEAGDTKSQSSSATSMPNTETRELVTIASAAPQTMDALRETNEHVNGDNADSSGIPPSSRRLLLVVASVVAAALVIYRYTLKSAQKSSKS